MGAKVPTKKLERALYLAPAADGTLVITPALIARRRLEIEKLKRDTHGSRSERKARLLD
ncbi:hypothetical protein [Mesorhizobium sp. M1399]|uniref:hypothetical protein n=1 Tax=Mesorhizobium sp. M1399 TaxID=2957096 RepID=UPI003339A88C